MIVYLPYLVAFVAAACLVFGLSAMFFGPTAPAAVAVPSLRRGGNAFGFALPGASAVSREKAEGGQSETELWLLQAGISSPNAARDYQLLRAALSIGLGIATALIMPFIMAASARSVLATAAVAGVIGFVALPYFISRRRNARQQGFREGLPDMLDLLLVCTEAGIGIDSALTRVGEELARTHPILARELNDISAQLRAGRTRADAMRAFGERTGIEETLSFVNLLVQSDVLGTSMADTLRVLAEEMRSFRLLKAEERGHTVTVKLTVILVACFLPAILAAILAPVVFHIIAGFSSLAISP